MCELIYRISKRWRSLKQLQQMKRIEMCFQLTRNVTSLKHSSANQVCKHFKSFWDFMLSNGVSVIFTRAAFLDTSVENEITTVDVTQPTDCRDSES